METVWLHNNDRQNLIIFCNGWGMDGGPFRFLTSSDYDVYMLYDYRKLNMPDIGAIAGKYIQVHLVSWSMGVWAGQKLFSAIAHLFHRTIAINGTLCPIDNRFGIPAKVFDATMVEFNEKARAKFYKRMCREKNNLNLFLSSQPQRSLEEQGEELTALRKMVDCLPVDQSIYREIIVAEKDFIMPTVNQLHYWQGIQTGQVTPVAGFHFLFNLWSSWDQLLDFSGAASKG
jgi:pimeloyl-[acyl-carrier protein] methyl ester esterase